MLPAFVFTTNELAAFCKRFSLTFRWIITRFNPTTHSAHKLVALVTLSDSSNKANSFYFILKNWPFNILAGLEPPGPRQAFSKLIQVASNLQFMCWFMPGIKFKKYICVL